MSDYLVAFLVLVALASIGSFAGSSSDIFQTQCVGTFLNICW
ncbi:MAG: hypothetical protein AAFR73_04255 [Pseudomonadota bacterium]